MPKLKIILAGGGTLGSVSPLLAIAQEIKKHRPEAEFLWLATRNGPEKKLINYYQIPYKKVFAGKWRRYFSWRNFFDPFLIFLGFIQSFFIILKFNPRLIISAGGFISVPVIWAGWFWRVPSLIHQQDIRPGIANKLTAPFAKTITVTFEKSLKDFSSKKTVLTGNPFREEILFGDKEKGYQIFNLKRGLPVLLILGGGTGALNINNLILDGLPKLLEFCQIIHLTGRNKCHSALDAESRKKKEGWIPAGVYPVPRCGAGMTNGDNYHPYEFLIEDLKHAYAVADLVISRAGLSVLTELTILGKPSILIPISGSHQKDNAIEFYRNNAAVLCEEKNISSSNLIEIVRELITDSVRLQTLSRNISKIMPRDASQKVVEQVRKIIY